MTATAGSLLARAMVRSLSGLVLFASVMTVYVLATRAPASKTADDRPAAAQTKPPIENSGTIKLDADDRERGGIATAAPKEISYQEQVRAYGTILPLDRLTTLYNNAITAAQQLKAAEIKLEASQTASARAHNLLKVFPSAAAQAETAEAAQNSETANVDAAKAQIDVIKNAAIQEWGPVLGAAIVARSPLASDLILRKSCLVQLTLQPGAMAEPPAHAEITFANGSVVEATYVSDATQTDAKIPNIGFFYTMPVAPGALAGASVIASFPKGAAKPSIVIPPAAIVWQAGRPWIYVQASSDRFERKAIDSDAAPTSDGGYVLSAMHWPQDQSVVVTGAQALLSEESRSQMRADDDDD